MEYAIVALIVIFIIIMTIIILLKVKKTYQGGDRVKDLSAHPSSKFEARVRLEFEKILGVKFPTVYPTWLNNYELDGYNEAVGVAFEAQGPQHTRFDRKYDKTPEEYNARVAADAQKYKKCVEEGVALIIIDYKVPAHLLSRYIKSRLYDLCIIGPKKLDRAFVLDKIGATTDMRPLWYAEMIHHEPYLVPLTAR